MPTIDDLVNAYTDLKIFYEDIRDDLVLAKNNLPDQLQRVIYVDEVNGLVGNNGAGNEPFESIDAAIDSVADGQGARIRLLSNCTWSKQHFPENVSMRFEGWNLNTNDYANRTVTFADVASNNAARAPGMTPLLVGMISFKSCDIDLGACLLNVQHFSAGGHLTLAMLDCSIDGAVGTAELLNPYFGSFSLSSELTVASNMGGRWIKGFGAGAPLTADAIGGIARNIDNT